MSLVVVTYGREKVLLRTLESLTDQCGADSELVVVDQSMEHSGATELSLAELEAARGLRRIRLSRPSIPAAMNRGLLESLGDVVLFVDDDVEPAPALVAAHRDAHRAREALVVAGQVLQPGEEPEPLAGDRFGFRSSLPQEVREVMGGNFSVSRHFALAIGGFDERFVGAAYRFEADFCERARAAGARIVFEPRASLRHLRAPRGGVRAHGSHLTTWRPHHAVGEYYYLLRRRPRGWARRALARLFRSVATRHHLRRPWWIPATLTAEVSGLLWALSLAARGPRLLPTVGGGA